MQKLIILLLFLPCMLNAQNQNWVFGRNVYFAAPGTSGFSSVNHIEGTSCLSDGAGQILAYSDGINAYDRNNAIMPNGAGLTGNTSTTQSALIVQQPNAPNILYLFTLNQVSAPIYYSIIDMSLNGGLGDVTSAKNVVLNAPFNMRESMAALETCLGDTVWIVSKRALSANFYAYPLTSTGIGPAVISAAGFVGTIGQTQGTLAFHPDGNRISVCYYGANRIETYRFNKSTGIVSFTNAYGITGCYDSKFAENLLYVFSNNGQVRQINVCAGTITLVASTTQTAAALGTGWYADDGRIYISRGNNSEIARINNPLIAGIGCNFNQTVALLPNNSMFGLQNIAMPYTRPVMQPFTYTSTCAQANLITIPRTCFEPCQYKWSGLFGSVMGINVTVNLPNGVHSITLERICDCETTSIIQNINVTGNILASVIGF